MTTSRRRRVGQQVLSFRRLDQTHGTVVQVVSWSDGELTIDRVPMVLVEPGAWVRDLKAQPC